MNINPTLFEMFSFSKLLARFPGSNSNVSLSVEEEKAAVDLLNKIVQNKSNFTQQQKDFYSALVEFAKADMERFDG